MGRPDPTGNSLLTAAPRAGVACPSHFRGMNSMSQQKKRLLLLPIFALAVVGLTALAGSRALYAQAPAAQQAAADVPSPASLAELKDLNERVKTLVAKVRPAVVQVSGGSGVVVSADGLVMCVAHVGGHAGRSVTFVFPDGRRARGVTLGNDRMGDAGLMRITDRGNWPHVDVAKPEDIELGEWCVALSYPVSFDQQTTAPFRAAGPSLPSLPHGRQQRLRDHGRRLRRAVVRHARPRHRHQFDLRQLAPGKSPHFGRSFSTLLGPPAQGRGHGRTRAGARCTAGRRVRPGRG